MFAVRLLALALALAPLPAAAQARPIHQLRVYEIFDKSRPAFHARFRDHAARIMKRHGFQILAMWDSRKDDRPRFVYLLEWPDEAVMKARWSAFMADAEWAEIKRRTPSEFQPMVGDIEEMTLVPTDYSPRLD